MGFIKAGDMKLQNWYNKKVRTALNKPVPLCLDTKGPEIRTGKLESGDVKVKIEPINTSEEQRKKYFDIIQAQMTDEELNTFLFLLFSIYLLIIFFGTKLNTIFSLIILNSFSLLNIKSSIKYFIKLWPVAQT